MRTIYSILFFTLAGLTLCYSQKSVSDSTLVEKFIEIYINDGVSESMDYLYASNPWMTDVDGSKKKLEDLVSDFGLLHSCELIKKATLNNRYSVFSYILLYDRQPLRFSFILYKPDKDWRFQSFRYDNDLEEEMINSTVVSWDF